MSHSKQWGSTHPGCLIILLDQSSSMSEQFGGNQLGAGKQKADMVATVLNSFLNDLTRTNMVGATVKPRADIAVLGYRGFSVQNALSGALAKRPFVTLPELLQNPKEIQTRNRREMDMEGKVIEIPDQFPIWVQSVSGGGTPMCTALRKARDLAAQWAASHADNYPPVVINVTDGEATDGDEGDVARAAAELTQVRTSDGEALLFNCHISSHSGTPVDLPGSETEVPYDQFARLLFSISSVLPDSIRQTVASNMQRQLPSSARGFIFNGDAGSVKNMFVFATVGQFNPNE